MHFFKVALVLAAVSGPGFGQEKTKAAAMGPAARYGAGGQTAVFVSKLAGPAILNPGDFRNRPLNIDLGLEHDDINRDFWFARDKYFHWGASAVIAASAYGTYRFVVRTGAAESMALAATSTLTIGLAKEDFDKNVKKSFFSYKDLIADGAGIATGLLFAGLCSRLF